MISSETSPVETRIVIIDDEPQIRKFLDIALRTQKYKTTLCETGYKGLEALATQGADLVILDLGLPDLDGKEVLQDDGYLKVDVTQRLVWVEQQPITLTRKEFQLLTLLMRYQGQLLTQPQLLKELWGPTHQEDTHYLRILVGKLRSKLGDNAIQPRYIATEPGVGLRFLAKQKNH